MVSHCIIVSTETPDDVVVELWTVNRQFTLCVHTVTTAASLFTTAVTVSNQVSLLVTRVEAAGDPGTWRQAAARRAGSQRTATAVTQVTVNRTMAPVVTSLGIFVLWLETASAQVAFLGSL